MTNKKLKPDLDKMEVLQDNILVDPIYPDEEITEDGIIKPAQYEDKAEQGVVVAKGVGRFLENGNRVPVEVEVGDFVLFNRYTTTEIKIGNKKYLFIRNEDILSRQS